ncbi:AraC family transcriptional regulator [Salipaludibacillus sp. CF4.18]|uniref:AraC family transcriptional regulator n=1 Tax=Salipaludibacillus sp. CF4.18 TaxID=3373081 RepID=UPI003EE57E14
MFYRREFHIPMQDSQMPLFTETIGYNPAQEKISRPDGYSAYHWIQTVRGKGVVTYQNKEIILPPNHGVLFLPDVPHFYERSKDTENWETTYFTFGGSMVRELLGNLEINRTAFYNWETNTPFSSFIEDVIKRGESSADVFSVKASADVYEFLISLYKYGKVQKNTTEASHLSKLYPLLEWMKQNVSNEEIGIEEMATYLKMSKRHLNSLFQQTFNLTPYTYFLNLRIQKAKKLLLNDSSSETIKQIAAEVGFRSPSHFIATFRKKVGVSPEKYRQLH